MGRGLLPRRSASRFAWVASVAIISVGATWVAAGADVVPPARVLTRFEASSGQQLHRDCGFSAALPGNPSQSLWLFCDTMVTDRAGQPIPPYPFRPGTWAAVGPSSPGLVPRSLSHLPSPPAAPSVPSDRSPQLFVPNPRDLVPSNASQCLMQASWALGLTPGPQGSVTMMNGGSPVTLANAQNYLFVTYGHVCVVDNPSSYPWKFDFEFKRVRLAAYDPVTNTIVATSTIFASAPRSSIPWYQQLRHINFADGHMYAYLPNCDAWIQAFAACGQGRAYVARAPVGSLGSGSTYTYKTTGGGWSSVEGAVDILATSGLGTMDLHVSNFSTLGKGYLLMQQLDFGGGYRLWQSSTPDGPWTPLRTGTMPCGTGRNVGCYHLVGQPALSTTSQLLYSYFSMTAAQPHGFVRVASIGTVPSSGG